MSAVLVLAGPSAVGKTTVMQEIISKNTRFEYVRSATTRAPRGDGKDAEYIYLSQERFLSDISSGKMLEYTEYGGNLYGTPAEEIDRILKMGRIPTLILDINGVKSLKSQTGNFDVFAVYIWEDVKILENRLYERMLSDKSSRAEETFKKRREVNLRDLSSVSDFAYLFDAFIRNTEVENTAKEILLGFSRFTNGIRRDAGSVENIINQIRELSSK